MILCNTRLLVVLAVVDSLHLASALLTFSLPRLSFSFCLTSYLHTVPFTLPLAQVLRGFLRGMR